MVEDRSGDNLATMETVWLAGHVLLLGFLLFIFVRFQYLEMTGNTHFFATWASEHGLEFFILFFTIISSWVYVLLALGSVVVLLIKRKLWWLAAFATLIASSVVFLGVIDAEINMFRWGLFKGFVWWLLGGVGLTINAFWFVYLYKFRKRYGVKWRPVKRKIPLNQPEKVWIAGHVIIIAWLIFGRVLDSNPDLLDRLPQVVQLVSIAGKLLVRQNAYLIYILLILASVVLLFMNRRIAWFLSLATLVASTMYFFRSFLRLNQMLRGSTEDWPNLVILGIVAIAVNVGWLFYYIKFRKRYGVDIG